MAQEGLQRTDILAVILLSLLSFFILRYNHRRSRHMLPFPPGPKPLPIVGNLFDLPNNLPWLTYSEWNQKYGETTPPELGEVYSHFCLQGDIVFIRQPQHSTAILGSFEAAQDLLEKKSAIYSSRPALVMDELSVQSPSMLLMI